MKAMLSMSLCVKVFGCFSAIFTLGNKYQDLLFVFYITAQTRLLKKQSGQSLLFPSFIRNQLVGKGYAKAQT